MTSRIENFFPTPVQIVDIDDNGLNKDLYSDIMKADKKINNAPPKSWNAKVSTSFNSDYDLFQLDSFERLRKRVFVHSGLFAHSLGYDIEQYPLRLSDMWFNIYKPGDWQEAHIHANNVISGIYYVSAPSGCGELIFHSPYSEVMIDPPTYEANIYNSTWVSIKPKNGQLILFKSSLRHSVKKNKCAKNRISIAFNLMM